jgi:hypothetical protein
MDAPTDIAIVEEVTAQGLPVKRPWLSALQRRRWETFKANRRGFWSLWIFLALFLVSLFVRRVHRQRQADPGEIRQSLLLADLPVLP